MKHPIQPLSPKRKENGMRPLVIYHGNCADGFSEWLGAAVNGEETYAHPI